MHTYINSQGITQPKKSFVLSLFLKVDREGAEVTLGGRFFQARAAATGKARLPTVESLVRGTALPSMWVEISDGSQHPRRGEDAADRQDGAIPCWHR